MKNKSLIIKELMKRAEKQPPTIKGLENTIKYCAVVMMLVSEDLEEQTLGELTK